MIFITISTFCLIIVSKVCRTVITFPKNCLTYNILCMPFFLKVQNKILCLSQFSNLTKCFFLQLAKESVIYSKWIGVILYFFLTADGVSFHIMQKKLKKSHKKGYWGYLCSCGKWSRSIYFTLGVGNIHP